MRILALIDAYLPGFKYGGPIRTLANLVDALHPEFSFYVYTRDRDRGDAVPYHGVRRNEWTRAGNAHVYYGAPDRYGVTDLVRQVRAIAPDLVYSQSFFASANVWLMIARRAGIVHVPHVIAPRGEFAPTALSMARWKKAPFLRAARMLRLLDDTVWQASAPPEAEDVRRSVGDGRDIRVAPDLVVLPAEGPQALNDGGHVKQSGMASFVYVGRVSAIKNVTFALETLSKLRGEVRFSIYGPCDSRSYWRSCARLVRSMPPNVAVEYHGELPHDRVPHVLTRHDFFISPSASENFGHAILEALAAGCPVLIGDRTPWRDLASRRVGWDLSLQDRRAWRAAAQACVDMDQQAHIAMRRGAAAFFHSIAGGAASAEAHRRLFTLAASRGERGASPAP